MGSKNIEKHLKKTILKNTSTLAQKVREMAGDLTFTILEIGARPTEGSVEPFYPLLDFFPGSRIIAFEADEKICHQLNAKAPNDIHYYPVALGRTEEKLTFYETNHPMCGSLFKPDEKLLNMYNNLDVAGIKSITSLDTLSLDYFTRKNTIESVDFIKIDIQGAELDVFKGGVNTLKDVVFVVSEVEFIPLYTKQPLFGDVCAFLTEKGLMFHKFLGYAGRTLKPIVIGDNPDFPTQHMWADAVFIRHIFKLPELPPKKLLKMGILAYIYGSPDLTHQCFMIYDQKMGTGIHKILNEIDKN